ncbi:SSI family serine proteinase inhibitor [Kineococcus sp. NUM-3379]
MGRTSGRRGACRGPRALAALTLAVLATTGLAACGQGGSGTVSEGTSSTGAPGPAAPGSEESATQDSLTVTVDDGSGGTSTWTLTCTAEGTPGGDHPDPAGACTALRAVKKPFAPVPKDMMCTQVYGGPETASVQGRWGGEDVDTTFQRTDGCQIARWNRVAALLQPGRPATSPSGPV